MQDPFFLDVSQLTKRITSKQRFKLRTNVPKQNSKGDLSGNYCYILSFGNFELINSLYFVNFKLGSKSQLTNSREISPKRKSNYDNGDELIYFSFKRIYSTLTYYIIYILNYKNRRITSNIVITRHS